MSVVRRPKMVLTYLWKAPEVQGRAWRKLRVLV
jgi:hypothetical protein